MKTSTSQNKLLTSKIVDVLVSIKMHKSHYTSEYVQITTVNYL